MACDGAGAVLTFTTATLNVFNQSTIEGLVQERTSVEKNILAQENTQYCPGGKNTTTPVTVTIFYEHAHYVLLHDFYTAKTVETMTITQSDGGITAGTGFIQSLTGPAAEDNNPQMITFTIQFDGITGPSITSPA